MELSWLPGQKLSCVFSFLNDNAYADTLPRLLYLVSHVCYWCRVFPGGLFLLVSTPAWRVLPHHTTAPFHEWLLSRLFGDTILHHSTHTTTVLLPCILLFLLCLSFVN